jgi:hypothetical protein
MPSGLMSHLIEEIPAKAKHFQTRGHMSDDLRPARCSINYFRPVGWQTLKRCWTHRWSRWNRMLGGGGMKGGGRMGTCLDDIDLKTGIE